MTIEQHCEFCYKTKDEVKVLVMEPMGVTGICDVCVALCQSIIDKHNPYCGTRLETFETFEKELSNAKKKP